MTNKNLVDELFKNLVHIGHRSEKWNSKMKPYVFGKRNKVYIFDLNKTAEGLEKAEKFLTGLKVQQKKVLFVGTKPQIALEIQRQVIGNDFYYLDKKWTPGFLTNFKELRVQIDFYLSLKKQFENGEINKYTKKEIVKFQKKLDKLEDAYKGVAEMKKLPDAVIVMDAKVNRLAIDEANTKGIPVVALTDANADPTGINFLIPGNDDAIKSVRFILQKLVKSLG
jgi:small subunit ribosomal protein S2